MNIDWSINGPIRIYSGMDYSNGSLTSILGSLLEVGAKPLLTLGGRQQSLNWSSYD